MSTELPFLYRDFLRAAGPEANGTVPSADARRAWEALLEPGAKGMAPARTFLRKIQEKQRWIPRQAVELAAKHYGVRFTRLYGEILDSPFYRTEPCGKVLLEVCQGSTCRDFGGGELLRELSRLSRVPPGRTAPDGGLTLEGGGCQGLCGMGPNVRLNDEPLSVDGPKQAKDLLRRVKEVAQTGSWSDVQGA